MANSDTVDHVETDKSTQIVECDGCQGKHETTYPRTDVDRLTVHNLNCTNGTPLIQGFGCDGMFAEYTAIHHRNAIILPENFDMATSAPYFCAGITGTSL